ncbi:MAG: DUF2807 domain-containing protein [Flavobacteriales bacterium]|nr:DUF2807 domain-containing protein [Flavobacteriales bacterium]
MKLHTFITRTFPLMLLAGIFMTSCVKDLRKKGSGVVITVDRNLDAFTDIDANGSFEIYTHAASDYSITITTDDNMIEDVQTFVQDGKLIIEMDDDVWNYKYTEMELHIYTPSVARVDLNGSVEFEMTDTTYVDDFQLFHNGSGRAEVLFEGNNLHMEVNGSADMSVAGHSDFAKYIIHGSGKINALSLEALTVEARIFGSGDIYTHCVNDLDAEIDGSGNIYYTGSPSVDSSINGSGNVKPY